MAFFRSWSLFMIPELRDRKTHEYDDRVSEHLINLREYYVPGLAHFWR